MRVALVTSSRFPEPHWQDGDLPAVASQLERLGVEVDALAWDADHVTGWCRYDALVLQSPWSMWQRLAEFRSWVQQRVNERTLLLNPPDVVALGTDKRYLVRLAAAGVPVVATTIVDNASTCTNTQLHDTLRAVFARSSPSRRTAVVKPLASGGSLGTQEFPIYELDQMTTYIQDLNNAGMAAIVQPYMQAIDVHRELDVVILDDDISHAITKAAILRPDETHRAFHPDPQPHPTLSAGQRAVILQTYHALVGLLPCGAPRPLSVRLDFVVDPDVASELVLLEIEMVAPVRFFTLFPQECQRYARSIVARIAAGAAAAGQVDRSATRTADPG
jgi:hypothetical protein